MPRSKSTLQTYHEKRNFNATPEPRGSVKRGAGNLFVVQKHDATRLHFDFRLELDGVLKSWAVTRGPSLDPADKRLAVRTEDHPIEYGGFEGVIPSGYGAGTVLLWDRGAWLPRGEPHEGLEKGSLKFTLDGERLKGNFALVRMKPRAGEKKENWLLIKERDEYASEETNPVVRWKDSVVSGRDLQEMSETGQTLDAFQDKQPAMPPRPKRHSKRGAMPAFVEPQLATLRDAPPEGDEWLHEIKYDGYRIQAAIGGNSVRLYTRSGLDWSAKYPAIGKAVRELALESALIDGELVGLNEAGISTFSLIQHAPENPQTQLIYFVFDLLSIDGQDLRAKPLLERKQRLKERLEKAPDVIRYSDHVAGKGEQVAANACAMGLEGIISKRADLPYRSGRGTGWIKSKCGGRDEFVIGGYRKSDKRRGCFASLLVGEYQGARLIYRGRVGTGFDDKTRDELLAAMKPLIQPEKPFAAVPAEARRGAVWVAPKLVAQIAYTERTPEGVLRHPAFLGLREDKPAKEIKTVPLQAAKADKHEPDVFLGVKLTSPDKVLYPDQGVTKRALVAYYAAYAETILPFVKDRPLSLVRCPEGYEKECFFQKHTTVSTPKAFGSADIEESDGKHGQYLVIVSAKSLIAAAQIGALELHVWGSRTDKVDRPERLVFDLDPDEGLSFDEVKAAAILMRDVLEAAGLRSFPLLTGGKGIHVVAPIQRRHSWPEVKGFARGLATAFAGHEPDRFIATMSKAKRRGKIFVDWMRNERGSTAIAPYSPRARKGAPVAVPVSWEDLPGLASASTFTLENASEWMQASITAWTGYFSCNQPISKNVLRDYGAA